MLYGYTHLPWIAMNNFFRRAMGSTPNSFSSSLVSAKNTCMVWYVHGCPSPQGGFAAE